MHAHTFLWPLKNALFDDIISPFVPAIRHRKSELICYHRGAKESLDLLFFHQSPVLMVFTVLVTCYPAPRVCFIVVQPSIHHFTHVVP